MNKDLNCPFCLKNLEVSIIAENELAFAIYDIYPVTKGHILVITKRHFQNYFEISKEENDAVFRLIELMKTKLENEFKPDGFNIGVNVGEIAGQTIPHVHVHLIPRYKGDMKNPRGGVRHVIPEKGNY